MKFSLSVQVHVFYLFGVLKMHIGHRYHSGSLKTIHINYHQFSPNLHPWTLLNVDQTAWLPSNFPARLQLHSTNKILQWPLETERLTITHILVLKRNGWSECGLPSITDMETYCKKSLWPLNTLLVPTINNRMFPLWTNEWFQLLHRHKDNFGHHHRSYIYFIQQQNWDNFIYSKSINALISTRFDWYNLWFPWSMQLKNIYLRGDAKSCLTHNQEFYSEFLTRVTYF